MLFGFIERSQPEFRCFSAEIEGEDEDENDGEPDASD